MPIGQIWIPWHPRPPLVPCQCQNLASFCRIGGLGIGLWPTITPVSDRVWPLASHSPKCTHPRVHLAQTLPPQPCLLHLTKATRCMKRRSRSLEPRASLAPTGWGPKLTRSTFTQTTMPQTMLPHLTFTPSGKVEINWQSGSPFVF